MDQIAEKTVLQVFTDARHLIADRARWTRDVLARSMTDLSVHPDDPSACSWCLDGALARVVGGDDRAYKEASLLLSHIAWSRFGMPYTDVNDSDYEDAGHANVMALLDAAIASARASEPSHADT